MIRPGESVFVDVYKWPRRRRYSTELTCLGSDEHGRWLGSVGFAPSFSDGTVEPVDDLPRVVVIPESGWWRARFTPGDLDVYVDIITPPEWSRTSVSYVDLELDVVRSRDGTVAVLDEAEFSQLAPVLSHEVRESAMRACSQIVSALQARAEPFGTVGARWLAAFVSRACAHPSKHSS